MVLGIVQVNGFKIFELRGNHYFVKGESSK